jgi:hemerythrin
MVLGTSGDVVSRAKEMFVEAQWTPAMSTGVPDLDHQHKVLIAHLNRLTQAMSEGRGPEQLDETLDFLQLYAAKHFADEESDMAAWHCPAAEENKRAHAEFIDRFGLLRAEVRAAGATDGAVARTAYALSTWLVLHIQGCDTQLRACIRQQPCDAVEADQVEA